MDWHGEIDQDYGTGKYEDSSQAVNKEASPHIQPAQNEKRYVENGVEPAYR